MSSSDEGEIVEDGVDDLKASSLPRNSERNGVDRPDRNRSRQSSVDHDYDNASRYSGSSRRSRSPRGFKRSRDTRDRERDRDRRRDYASRNSRHYDDRRNDSYQRQSISYDDLDRPPSRDSWYGYDERDQDRRRDGNRYRDDDRDRHPEKRVRIRSRSPQRSKRRDFVREGHYDSDRRDAPERLRYNDRPANGKGGRNGRMPVGDASQKSQDDAKSDKGRSRPRHVDAQHSSEQEIQKSSATEPERDEQDFEETEPIDEEAEIQRRRKRREEILAKSSSATPLLLHAVGAGEKARAGSPIVATPDSPARTQMDIDSPRSSKCCTYYDLNGNH